MDENKGLQRAEKGLVASRDEILRIRARAGVSVGFWTFVSAAAVQKRLLSLCTSVRAGKRFYSAPREGKVDDEVRRSQPADQSSRHAN